MTKRYAGTMNDDEMIQRHRVPTDKISAPTLILHAKDDSLVSYQHAEHAHEAIKLSRLISFEIQRGSPQLGAWRAAPLDL